MTIEAVREPPEEFADFVSSISEESWGRYLPRDSAGAIVIRDDIMSFRPRNNRLDMPDVTGAFKPEAHWFAYVNSVGAGAIYVVDNSPPRSEEERRSGAHRRRVNRETQQPILDAIQNWSGSPLGAVVFFCHGDAEWLQLGFDLSTLPSLAEAIATKAAPDVRVILYACLTGASPEEEEILNQIKQEASGSPEQRQLLRELAQLRSRQVAGSGGMAFTLRNLLIGDSNNRCPDASVIAHATEGHPTGNPYVRRFAGPADSAGQWVVPPSTWRGGREANRLWQRWARTLRDPLDSRVQSPLRWQFPLITDAQIHQTLTGV